jgi:hypothetical protein
MYLPHSRNLGRYLLDWDKAPAAQRHFRDGLLVIDRGVAGSSASHWS